MFGFVEGNIFMQGYLALVSGQYSDDPILCDIVGETG